MSQTMREALEWTTAALQEVFRTNHNCSEHDRIVIGGSSATVREILHRADAALSAPSREQAQQGADHWCPLEHGGVICRICDQKVIEASRPAAVAPAVGMTDLARQLEALRKKHWMHWSGLENDVAHWCVQALSGAALAGAAPAKPTTAGAYLRKKADDYAMEYGHNDMGGLSFGSGAHAEAKQDYHNNLLELADELDALNGAAQGAEPAALIADILAQDDKVSRALALVKIESRTEGAHRDWKAMQKTWDELMNRAREIAASPQPPTGTSQENQQ